MTSARVPLLLDVDGVVNVLRTDPGYTVYDATAHDGLTYRLHIAPETPDLIAELAGAFEIVWCTTWRNANEAIAPLLGLPSDLRQVWFPTEWLYVPWDLCRKTTFVAAWAKQHDVRRLAWLDDEIGEADSEALRFGETSRPWLSIEPLDDVLLLPCDPTVGLTRGHVARMAAWRDSSTDQA